jgi:HEAT repeat protein
MLRDPDPALRGAAAEALGALGDREARGDLAQAYAREPSDAAAGTIRDAILRLDLRNP